MNHFGRVQVALLGFLVFSGWVDSPAAKSIFSFNGVGDTERRVDVRARGMGGAGRALADSQNFSSANPALLAAFSRAGLQSRFFVQRRSLNDGQRRHVVSDGDIGAFQIVLPIRNGTVLGAGLEPLTDLDFDLVSVVGATAVPYELRVNATGGIQALTFGVAHRWGSLMLGGNLNIISIGTIKETWTKDFSSSGTDGDSGSFLLDANNRQIPERLNSEDRYVRTHSGTQPALGAVYNPGSRWFFGAAFRAATTITQTRILRNFFAEIGFEEETRSTLDLKMPAGIGVGLAYRPGYRWLAALDYERAFWEKTESGRYNTTDLAGGILYRLGDPDSRSTRRRIELTAGAHYRSLYFKTDGDSQIGELGVSLGISLPFETRGAGSFRYVVEFGRRGDVTAHGASERFVIQTFSLSGWLD